MYLNVLDTNVGKLIDLPKIRYTKYTNFRENKD